MGKTLQKDKVSKDMTVESLLKFERKTQKSAYKEICIECFVYQSDCEKVIDGEERKDV